MRILILEDDPARIRAFGIGVIGHDATVTSGAKDAIQRLSVEPFDLIFLDHDLDGRTFVPTTDDNCGTRVAEWLSIPENRAPHGRVVIHSFNRDAALAMQSMVPGSSYIPGAWVEAYLARIVEESAT